jgi:hypothetical protein
MKSVLVFDPGDHTGWCFRDTSGRVVGGTCGKHHMEVAERIQILRPDIVVFERFNLYPQMAKSLAWNSFYPCEVIGVIRYLCDRYSIPIVEQAPSVKKYFGGFQQDWDQLKALSQDVTEHTKDAYQHLKYFERNGEKKFKT